MLGNRIRGLWNLYHGILAVVLTVLYWVFLIAVSPVIQGWSIADYPPFILYNVGAVAGLIIAAIRNRSDAATLLAGGFINYHKLALKQTVYIGVVLLLTLALGMEPEFRHMRIALLFVFLASVYVVFLICHFLIPGKLADQLFSEQHEQRTLLVGPVEKARAVHSWIIETRAFGFGLRGSPTESDTEDGRLVHLTHVESESMLERIIRNEGIRQIFLLELPRDRDLLSSINDTARKLGVRLLVLNDLPEIFRHDISFFHVHDKDLISLSNEPLEDPVNRLLKRSTDMLISLPIVLFVLPCLSILVKIVQVIESPGPLLHRETRAGLNNLPFRIFNFRTTPLGSTIAAAKSNNQARYSIGLWLRRHSVDRFPEFLNVFLGDMSVVGPRPQLPIHNRRFSQVVREYHCRTFAKPGITGLAQMSGYRGEVRDDADIVERTKLDLKYIENWSLPLDFWIIFKTIPQLFKPPTTAS
jgi:lipopolysaccharide/colanic/teichoic acid biosynthesis glycosyltransferase